MKISLLLTGKTSVEYVKTGIQDYSKRIERYVSFEIITVPDIKNAGSLPQREYCQYEAELQKKFLQQADFIVLLDEKGKELSSVELATFIQHKMQIGIKNIMFVIGGAYGFSDEVKKMAHICLSLSKLTFPHQLVRIIFTEQLYRAFTIINREKYHHI